MDKTFSVTDEYYTVFSTRRRREVNKEIIDPNFVTYEDADGTLSIARNFDYSTYYNRIFDKCQREGQDLNRLDLRLTTEEFLEALRDGYISVDPESTPTLWHSQKGRVMTFKTATVGSYAIVVYVYESREDRDQIISAIGVRADD